MTIQGRDSRNAFFTDYRNAKTVKNRKPLLLIKPQYRNLKQRFPQNRVKFKTKPHHRKPLRPPQYKIEFKQPILLYDFYK